ncbi:hypothetical protein BJR07_23960 [Bacillus cereus]|uniref:Uncharacterized protein n=1 Tax=Bacillus cereus TaxID=1396 RepID=A0A1Q4L802_BACCE|nr:hypothetical protein BJR07_23960 [Bacillus cereus]OKA38336.1 hypothetical protein BJR06_12950 [Bacillus cereus]
MKEIMIEVLVANELGDLKEELLIQGMIVLMDMTITMKYNTTEIILNLLIQVEKNRVGYQMRNTERNKQRTMHTFIEDIVVIDIRWRKLMMF